MNDPAEDEPLQAVVVADVFHDRFAPVVSDLPFALLPLVGVPIIDYTLESLAQSGVNETFLFCSSHAEQIKLHIQKSLEEKAAWSVSMVVHIIVSENCLSFGDALRDLDAKGLINGFFILSGIDTISNVKLLPLLEKHKETCKRDKGAAMTLVYKSAIPGHRAQSVSDNVLLISDKNTNRVLLHQKLSKNSAPKVCFPIEIFLDTAETEIRSDLLDTHIAICSPSVLLLFAENFDFQTRDDFVKGILMNEEILANTIYWYQLHGDQYAAAVTNWQMYQILSQDIIHRWVFPLVPDMGISKQQHTYMLLRNHVYRQRDISLAKICTLEEYVVIASGSSVGENSIITRSVIGKNCVIGDNCRISDSFVMDDCVVNNKCRVVASVLSSQCILSSNVDINSAVLGSGVQLDENVTLKECVIQRTASDDASHKIGNMAYIVENKVSDDESIDSDASDIKNLESGVKLTSVWRESESTDYSSSSDEESTRTASPIQEDTNLFLQEVIDSLARGYEEKLKCDYLILEINSSRYAYNMSLQDVNMYVIEALLQLPPMQTTNNVLTVFNDLLKFFAPVVSNYIKGPNAMMDCLKAVEESCEKNEMLALRVAQIIHLLYEKDVISEDAVLKWYENILSRKTFLSTNKGLKKFIDWLEEASEESD